MKVRGHAMSSRGLFQLELQYSLNVSIMINQCFPLPHNFALPRLDSSISYSTGNITEYYFMEMIVF